jgi:hypothetical protein
MLGIAAGLVLAPTTAWAAVERSAPVSTIDTSAIVASRQGDAQVVDAVQRAVPLATGGSTTEFSLELPAESDCPGDSEHDSWRVQTFLVPSTIDPGTLTWAIGPQSDAGTVYSLYDTFTQPVIEGLLPSNDGTGKPARITTLPPMDFAVFVPKGTLAAGTYRVGVACTNFGATGPYWDTELTVSADASDEPAGLAWAAPGTATVSSQSNDDGFPWIYLAIGAALIGLLGWFLFQRARRTTSSPKEMT